MRRYRIRSGSLAELAMLIASAVVPYLLSLLVVLLILKGF